MASKFSSRTLLLVFILTSKIVYCGPVSNNSTSDWYDPSGWNPNAVPNLLIWDASQNVVVSHNKSANDLTVKNGNSIRVTAGTVLTINGDLTLGNRSSITVDAGAVLLITGSLISNNSPSTVLIDGTLNVGEDYLVKTSSVTHEYKGLLTVGGDFNVLGNTNIKILGGTVAITGKLKLGNNGVMSGCSGRVNYGSYDINSCGFSYLICCTDKRGTGCMNTPPPAKGMDFSNCNAPPLCNSIGGIAIGSDNSVCSGNNAGDINLLGHNGSIVRWEKSTNNWGVTTTISNTKPFLSYSNISVTTKYRAIIKDGGCGEAISHEATVTVVPASSGGFLSKSTTVCSGENSGMLFLTGEVGSVVRWEKSIDDFRNTTSINNKSQTASFSNLNTTTKYRAVVKSGFCSMDNSNEITVFVQSLPYVNLGSDTSVCMENTYSLDAGPNGKDYLWNDGSTNKTVRITKNGMYSVRVEDSNNCVSYDEINVNILPSPKPTIKLKDEVLCGNNSVLLSVDPGFSNYIWTNSASNTNEAEVENANIYIVKIYNNKDCFVADTSVVSVGELPNLNLEDSVPLCYYKDLYISVLEMDAEYAWSTGSESQKIKVTNPGEYWVNVSSLNKCSKSDTIFVYEGPELDISLGNDTTICLGASIVLDAGDYSTEIWQGLDTASELFVDTPSIYNVLAINENGCFGMDSIFVDVRSTAPVVKIVQEDSLQICEFAGDEIELSIQNDEGMDIVWSTGEEGASTIIYSAGQIIVRKINEFDCPGKDTLTILPYCRPVVLSMPNIFTPNGDGINDQHIPLESTYEDMSYLMSRVKTINYSIRNRWGITMYNSQGELPYWNGTHYKSGLEASEGTYFWVLSYKDAAGGDFSLNGFVELIR